MAKQNLSKAQQIIDYGLHPVLLGRAGDALKKPQLTGWPTARYTPQDVAKWPQSANVGILCGEQPDGRFLSVFDFDKFADENFPKWRKAARAIIGDAPIVKTGRDPAGFHVLVKTETPQQHGMIAGDPIVDSKGKTRDDVIIEIRGQGQQVVSPGSLHPSGQRYELIAGSLANIPTVTSAQFAQLVKLAAAFDRRQPKQPRPRSVVTSNGNNCSQAGELAGLDCLAYARKYIHGDEQIEPNGDIRILGNGGLLLTANGRGWNNRLEDVGGGLVALIAWHKGIEESEAAALVRGDKPQETAKTAPRAPRPAPQASPQTAQIAPQTAVTEYEYNHAFMSAYENPGQAPSANLAQLEEAFKAVGYSPELSSLQDFIDTLPDDIFKAVMRKNATGGDLARAAWGDDAVMAAPGRQWLPRYDAASLAHAGNFTGTYPLTGFKEHCRFYWKVNHYETSNGEHVHKGWGAHYPILHDYQGKRGVIEACPHCIAERTLELCKMIEKAAVGHNVRYGIMSDAGAKKLQGAIKKRNQRGDGAILTVVKVPQVGGQTWILHDVPDVAGAELPTDRKELHALIYERVKLSPKGRRGWRGLATWGQPAKPQDAQDAPGDALAQDDTEMPLDDIDDDLQLIGTTVGVDWVGFEETIAGFLKDGQRIGKRAVRFECPMSTLTKAWDKAKLNYCTEWTDVPLKIVGQETTILSGTNGKGKALQLALPVPRGAPIEGEMP